MKEDFLYFIWQLQYFNTPQLFTTQNTPIQIVKRGSLNTNAGPDFLEALLKIDDMEWAGHIEMHLKASDWYTHNHDKDAAYDNVILHVVWEANQEVLNRNGNPIPTVELRDKVPFSVLNRYQELMEQQDTIACASQFSKVNRLSVLSMLDHALSERLNRKADEILQRLANNNGDWETTAYQLLCKNLGFKVNAAPFEQLATALPVRILYKHSHSLFQLEALLFGQAGFLEAQYEDEYLLKLQQEYAFLKKKYKLTPIAVASWKFLRMRPANFPTVRLAQLAAILAKQQHFFATFLNEIEVKSLQVLFQQMPSSYWRAHYMPEKKSKRILGTLGKQSLENILINTAAPLQMAMGIYQQNDALQSQAVALLENLKAENNRIMRLWKTQGLVLQSAFDSQAALELYQQYCTPKRCLACKIGASLLT